MKILVNTFRKIPKNGYNYGEFETAYCQTLSENSIGIRDIIRLSSAV